MERKFIIINMFKRVRAEERQLLELVDRETVTFHRTDAYGTTRELKSEAILRHQRSIAEMDRLIAECG